MAGTNSELELLTGGPIIILVEPQLGENIGMVARAMANFGLSDLRLVNPRDGWPSEKARASASRADHVIDNVQVFETLHQAVSDLNFVMATTARLRDGFKQVRAPEPAANMLRNRHRTNEKTGILFGRERWGLTNEEVSIADEIVTFPVNPAFASLNIAQAVLLMSYEWMKSGMEDVNTTSFQAPDQRQATKAELGGFLDHVEEALDQRGYFRPAAKKPKMVDNLRAVLTRRSYTEPEIRVMRGIISSLDRFSRKGPKGQAGPFSDQTNLNESDSDGS